MAMAFHFVGRRRFALANPLAQMDAPLERGAGQQHRRGTANRRDAAVAIGLGHLRRPILRQLLLVFPFDLATLVLREGAQLLHSEDGYHYRGCVLRNRRNGRDRRLDL